MMGSGGTKVCIIDSGYDEGHEDLPNTGVTFDTNANTDGCSHGSHVAGTVAAVDNNVGVIGVAHGVELHIVKVFADNCNWSYSSGLIGALDACEAANATVVSMSLGRSCATNSCASSAEDMAFADAFANGVLSIAAAGNGGNTWLSFPASYDSVVSVAAIDEANNLASFSQQNSQVELAAPGVSVRSTVQTGTGLDEYVSVDGVGYNAIGMDGSPFGTGTGLLFRCNSVNGLGSPGDCEGAGGMVCLIQRGTISFADKVDECADKGGVAAVIYNNVDGSLSGTLGGAGPIPAVGISKADGDELANPVNNHLGKTSSVTVLQGHYAYYDGTSMATPHVSGVAALVWSHCSDCTATEVRTALQDSAMDLGAGGRDTSYGYGLVQANAALVELQTYSCCAAGTTTTTLPPPTTTTVAGTTTTTTTTPPPQTTTTTTGPVTITEKWSCSKNPVDPLTVCQESYSSSAECEAANAETADQLSCGNGPKVCYKYECLGTGPVATTAVPGTTTTTTAGVTQCDSTCTGCDTKPLCDGQPGCKWKGRCTVNN